MMKPEEIERNIAQYINREFCIGDIMDRLSLEVKHKLNIKDISKLLVTLDLDMIHYYCWTGDNTWFIAITSRNPFNQIKQSISLLSKNEKVRNI